MKYAKAFYTLVLLSLAIQCSLGAEPASAEVNSEELITKMPVAGLGNPEGGTSESTKECSYPFICKTGRCTYQTCSSDSDRPDGQPCNFQDLCTVWTCSSATPCKKGFKCTTINVAYDVQGCVPASNKRLPIIIGSVVGAIVLLAICALAFYCIRKKKNDQGGGRRRKRVQEEDGQGDKAPEPTESIILLN